MFSNENIAQEPELSPETSFFLRKTSHDKGYQEYIGDSRAISNELLPYIEEFFDDNKVLFYAINDSAIDLPEPVPVMAFKGTFGHVINTMLPLRLAQKHD